MRIFDLHADIGYDIYMQHQKEDRFILDEKHAPKMEAGEIGIVCMASFFEGVEDWKTMQTMISQTRKELEASKRFQLILEKTDFPSIEDKGLYAIMSVEGMCGIQEEPEKKAKWMYDQGVRLASLVWNEENALATGAFADPNKGLSELGKRMVKALDELGIVIDVSHANEKTFWDIMQYSKGKVIATHSNVRALSDHVRCLKDEQIKAICERNGVIGMNAVYMFVSQDHKRCGVDELAKHAAYIKAKFGIEYIACGFDFMDFYDDSVEDEMVDGMPDASYAQAFVKALERQGFQEDEISKICFENAKAIFCEN